MDDWRQKKQCNLHDSQCFSLASPPDSRRKLATNRFAPHQHVQLAIPWWLLLKRIDGSLRVSNTRVDLQRLQYDIRKYGGFLFINLFELFINLNPARWIARPVVLPLQLYQLHLQLAKYSSFGLVLVKLAVHGLRRLSKQSLHFRSLNQDGLLRLNEW